MTMPYYTHDPLVRLDRHRIEFTPYPGNHDTLGFVATKASCSCGTWASNRPWERDDHLRGFARHMGDVQVLAHTIPAEFEGLTVVALRCVDAEHARAVVRDWPAHRDAEHGLFGRDANVFIAYRDSEFPCEVAVWAHLNGHVTDIYAGRLLREVA
ncbi:hypothetical protein [Streptomyces sp. SID3343]|uniref:hypothetical protein n=1 Tax=Streptomyces sp. SID3343 TaxID=2690260 RepID=UPI0013712990|nr:hypothetical protein [Streptomyces sp. SID3343]MYW06323.1 hypothetical protein [Streptomyces sp. SID3343]